MNMLEDYRFLDENGKPRIRDVYDLKHFCGLYGTEEVSRMLGGKSLERIEIIRLSLIPGSTPLDKLFELDGWDFAGYTCVPSEAVKERQRKAEKEEKAWILGGILSKMRESFAKTGTCTAKKRLNKLARTDPIAQAVRLALEIEDKNIVAMNTPYPYRLDTYSGIESLFQKLKELFDKQGWPHGTLPSDDCKFDVFYFDIPGCEQISWRSEKINEYETDWDVVDNFNLDKIEKAAEKLLVGYKVGRNKTVQAEAGCRG